MDSSSAPTSSLRKQEKCALILDFLLTSTSSHSIFLGDTLLAKLPQELLSHINSYAPLSVSSITYDTLARWGSPEYAFVTLDRVNLQDYTEKCPWNQASFHGIYDGHGGKDTTEGVAKQLHPAIFSSPAFAQGEIQNAITQSFTKVDGAVVEESIQNGCLDGCCAVVGIILDGKLIVANIGDGQAIVISEDDFPPIQMTTPHLPSDPIEKARIQNLGGHVFFNRLFGTLAVSRAFGNYKYKKPRCPYNFLECEPAIHELDLKQSHKYILFANGGFWDKISFENAATMVKQRANEPVEEIPKALINEALKTNDGSPLVVVLVQLNWKTNL